MNKLTTTILAGALLAGAAATASADREIGIATGFTVTAASTTTDLARTRDENGVQKLRPTDEEFTNEQASVLFVGDRKTAIYIHMRTGNINEGTAMESSPNNQMQCAITKLNLTVDTAGAFKVARPASGPGMYDMWATDNNGNEYRNCNKPQLYEIGPDLVGVEFNYQPNDGNDTKRYVKVLRTSTFEFLTVNGQEQAVVMAKNNDDCDMHQSGANVANVLKTTTPGKVRVLKWAGCNGQGEDDGWANMTDLDCTSGTDCIVTREFDISLAQREERSRGRCHVTKSDPDLALCSWTEGNDQPQREGVWVAGIDISVGGQQGPEAQDRILWKERIEREGEVLVNGEPRETYAMRMNMAPVLTMDATGMVTAGDDFLLTYGKNRGGNNNDKKGGRSIEVDAMIIKASRTGYTETMPKTNITPLLLGFDNTHVSVTEAVFGKGTDTMPGWTMVVGSQNGGLASTAEIRTIMYDPTSKTFKNLGQHSAAASYDRHLYSNYLGNNPTEQGRNFAHCDLVQNPYADMSGNFVTYFQACALTGKLPEHTSSAIKPSAQLALFPISFTKAAPPPGGGWDDEQLPGEDNPTPDDDTGPGTSVGGCSSSSGSPTLLLGLALGLATFIRRRK